MPTKFEWAVSFLLPVLLTYSTVFRTVTSSKNGDNDDFLPSSLSDSSQQYYYPPLLLWILFMLLDATYGNLFHLLLLIPARYTASYLPGAILPSLHEETNLLQQEAQVNDASIVWPAKRVLQQLPNDWLSQRVHTEQEDYHSIVRNNPNNHNNHIHNQTNKIQRNVSKGGNVVASNQSKQQKKKHNSNSYKQQHFPSILSQPYYLNHVRGSTRIRHASQRVGAAMGTLFATYLLCHSSLSTSSSFFTNLKRIGLHCISYRQVLMDCTCGILIGSIIVLFLFGIELQMEWIRIVGYWEKVVPNEKFVWNFLWDIIFHLGVSVNEEIMLRGWMFHLGCRGMLPIAMRWVVHNPPLAATVAILLSILLQSTLFAFMHFHSPGSTRVSLLNLFIGGIAASWNVMLPGGTLWLVIGWHFGWNITMGHILGRSTSGIPMSCAIVSVVPRPSSSHGKSYVKYHGGMFGPEQGVIAPFSYLLGMGLMYWIYGWENFIRWKDELLMETVVV